MKNIKTCTRCKVAQPISNFYKSTKGHYCQCIKCCKEKNALRKKTAHIERDLRLAKERELKKTPGYRMITLSDRPDGWNSQPLRKFTVYIPSTMGDL
jgi:hypothetical protein